MIHIPPYPQLTPTQTRLYLQEQRFQTRIDIAEQAMIAMKLWRYRLLKTAIWCLCHGERQERRCTPTRLKAHAWGAILWSSAANAEEGNMDTSPASSDTQHTSEQLYVSQ